uniref:Uracil-DNA glycosylase n=1 Tax=Pithovirus LCDPAC01 TaxID=2506600 RepID=A0A481YN03_9VIRU|nr:MAG: uracil-DNA glycosylase [Pithovirus LCDPAC01]
MADIKTVINLVVTERPDIKEDMSLEYIAKNKRPRGWEKVFEYCIPELRLLDKILESEDRKNYFPMKKEIFAAFDACTLDNVEVVILGQDPYHSTYKEVPQACGLAFSTRRNCPTQPSVKNIYAELKREYPLFVIPDHGYLINWAVQGVLLLNTCLTVEAHKPKSHGKIWKGFIIKIFEAINAANPKAIYLLWGRTAHSYSRIIGDSATKLRSSHPSPLSWKKKAGSTGAFYGSSHFTKVNEILIANGKNPIDWKV